METILPSQLRAWQIAEKCKVDHNQIDPLIDFFVERNKSYKDVLNTHIYFNSDEIYRQVEELKTSAYEDLPLAFVPILVKDNICTENMPTTCASKILKGYQPPYSATVIDRLRKAGGIIFGKLNCDEFAMGSSNENSAFGPVLNPWNKECVPGGSSGGSAAAVSAGLTPIALGSDTGGSIRQPASYCGVFGYKPSYGMVSRYGLIAFASSLDQIGPLTTNSLDAALVSDVIVGYDDKDSTSLKTPVQSWFQDLKALKEDQLNLQGVKIGVVSEFFTEGIDEQVNRCLQDNILLLKDLGATIKEISLKNIKSSISTYYVIATAEASANLARYDGIRYGFRAEAMDGRKSLKDMYINTRTQGFGDEVKRRIFLGTYVLSSGYKEAYYSKATRMRQAIKEDFLSAFDQVDFLLGPTAPTTAFKIGEKNSDPLSMYLNDIYTIAVNLAGLPAISLPCGLDQKGLPIGMQFIGKPYEDFQILKGAYVYEQATRWHEHNKPKL